ncbi:MAG: diphthine--ammonia ligase [Clostridium sp.]
MSKNFVMSYSCGKDSTLALYRLIKQGYNPVGLIVKVNKEDEKNWVFRIPKSVIEEVANSLGIPLYIIKCEFGEYQEKLETLLKEFKNNGVDYCAFGDIDVEGHRVWCTERCENANLTPLFPLWGEEREKIVNEFIDAGFKTIISVVKLEFLDKGFLGQELTKELVEKIKERGADPCGENGEYHTLVYDGPLFKQKINHKIKDVELSETYGILKW